MRSRALLGCFVICLSMASLIVPAAIAAVPSDPAQGSVWDLSPLFRDEVAWEEERVKLDAALPALSQLRNNFGLNARAFRESLNTISEMRQRLYRLGEYASLKSDEDAALEANQVREQQMSALRQRFAEATAFVEPAVLALGRSRIEAFEQEDAGLARYRRPVELVLRRAAHRLSPEAESILLAARPLQRQPSDIHDALFYADIPWPSLEIDGKTTRMGLQAYRSTFFNVNREVRRKAFESVMTTLSQYERTAGAIAYAFMNGTAFEAKARHYPTSLALAISDDAMPEADFQTLVTETDRALPALHRYLKLRRTFLGLDELHVYDLHVPLTTSPHHYNLSEAEAIILKALEPLGADYVRRLKDNFQAHAMHAIAAPNKTPGAQSDFAAYRTQPFVMLTFDGTFESVGAVAHEWGHAIHAQLFQAAQPFENAALTSEFLFDTPSLVNEILLSDYMIAKAKSRQDKIVALDQAIDLLRYSYFGAISGIGLELKAHELADRGEPVTGRALNEVYCALQKHFNGSDTGVTKQDESACFGWMAVPLYYDFYFYKYVNAASAAGFFADALEKRDAATRERYFNLLKAGGSDDPDILFKRAGFDAGSPTAYQPMIRRIERLVAQLEAVVSQPNADNAK